MKPSTRNRNGVSVARGTEPAVDQVPSRVAGAGLAPGRTVAAGAEAVGRDPMAHSSQARITEPKALRPPTREEISARAYEIYLSRKNREGTALEDWLRAEHELKGSPQA